MASPTISTPEALRLIQLFVAIPLLAYGLYMVTPWYVVLPGQTAFGGIALQAAWVPRVPAVLFVLAGIGTIYGSVKGNSTKLAKASIWFAMSMYVFLLATRVLEVGLIPLTWVVYIPMVGITAVLALSVRTR